MNSAEKRIKMQIPRLARSPVFRISKPFLSKFITASRQHSFDSYATFRSKLFSTNLKNEISQKRHEVRHLM